MKRVLIVDDEIQICEWFQRHISKNIADSIVEISHSKNHATTLLKNKYYNVVLMDMRLPSNASDGYELIRLTKTVSPRSQIVAFTAKPDINNGLKCIRAGCSDYLDKMDFDNILDVLLKLIQYSNSTVDQNSIIERLILTGFIELKYQTSNREKGHSLETLCFNLFKSINGFTKIEINKNSRTEEFDLVIRNEASDEFWKRFNMILLVECKFMTNKKPGKNEFISFYNKIKNRSHNGTMLGFFISINGFATTFHVENDKIYKENIVIIPIDKQDLWNLICANDRSEFLKTQIQNQILR